MTPEQFKDWRVRYYKTQSAAADALGVTRGTVANYEAGIRRDGKPAPIPHTVALAMTALANGLKAWDEYGR